MLFIDTIFISITSIDILKKTRDFLTVKDASGNVLKYRLVPKAKPKPKGKPKRKPKVSVTKEKKPFEILADSMPSCCVLVPKLTVENVSKIKMAVKREHIIYVIKTKIVTMPSA